jgi:hypothetical protein
MKVLLLALCLSLALVSGGCAAFHHPLHPGAVSQFDSDTYDELKGVQITIANSRDQLAKGVLPPSFKPVIANLETAYSKALPVYKAWHTAAVSGTSTSDQLAKLKAVLAAIDAANATFRSAK